MFQPIYSTNTMFFSNLCQNKTSNKQNEGQKNTTKMEQFLAQSVHSYTFILDRVCTNK